MYQIVIGLGYGDEGKGTIVDYLTAEANHFSGSAPLNVRFSGGAQAAHNVVTVDGTHHTFSQFGSGTFHGASTVLTDKVMVNPVTLFNEAQALAEKGVHLPMNRLYVSENALLTTQAHMESNTSNSETLAHGSTGMGIGATVETALALGEDALYAKDIRDPKEFRRKLVLTVEHLFKGEREYLVDDIMATFGAYFFEGAETTIGDRLVNRIVSDSEIRELIANDPGTIFEGSQGMLLDTWVGFAPHTTWSDLGPDVARSYLPEGAESTVIGVTRTFHTRHGNGPMPGEDSRYNHLEKHNGSDGYQGAFRTGTLSMDLLNYAIRRAGMGEGDQLALTWADLPQRTSFMYGGKPQKNYLEARYELTQRGGYDFDYVSIIGDPNIKLNSTYEEALTVNSVESRTNLPVTIISYGETANHKSRLLTVRFQKSYEWLIPDRAKMEDVTIDTAQETPRNLERVVSWKLNTPLDSLFLTRDRDKVYPVSALMAGEAICPHWEQLLAL